MVEKVSACKKIATIFGNNDHFDSIIALLAVAVKDSEKNVEKAIEVGLMPLIADILQETGSE
jgi:hypothetical protein